MRQKYDDIEFYKSCGCFQLAFQFSSKRKMRTFLNSTMHRYHAAFFGLCTQIQILCVFVDDIEYNSMDIQRIDPIQQFIERNFRAVCFGSVSMFSSRFRFLSVHLH